MSVVKLPSGRWRAQVHDPRVGHNVSVSKILPSGYVSSAGEVGNASFRTKTEAKDARSDARRLLKTAALIDPRRGVTVAEFRERWLTDPMFHGKWKDGAHGPTAVHNRERTKTFADIYGHMPISDVDDETVVEWLAGGRRNGTVPALRAMFNAARTAKAGRLVAVNPFAELGLERAAGNRFKQPASEEMVWALIDAARRLSGPYMAAWLQVASFTGMRPAEIDILGPERLDFASGRIRVAEQWNATTNTITTPKNGLARWALMTPPAREALLGLPRDGDYVFVNLRGGHFTTSARAYHWKAIRAAAGWDESLYLATRHFAGWYMVNVLELDSEDVAIALGHTDGGELVRRLYGHRDHAKALARVQAAYERSNAGNVRPLRVVDGSAS